MSRAGKRLISAALEARRAVELEAADDVIAMLRNRVIALQEQVQWLKAGLSEIAAMDDQNRAQVVALFALNPATTPRDAQKAVLISELTHEERSELADAMQAELHRLARGDIE